MTGVVLVTAQPRNPTTGATTTVRLAGGGNRQAYFYGGNHFRSGLMNMPRFKAQVGYGEDGWTGYAMPATSPLAWMPATKALLAEHAAFHWPGAAITVQEGDEDTAIFTTRLTGKVADAPVRGGQLIITAADHAKALGNDFITARFAGTGGAEGGTEAKGRAKRRSFGRLFNIEGFVLDKANNIFEFGDPNYQWQSFETIRDKARDAAPAHTVVAWQGTVAATLAALIAATPVQGTGVAAPSICCVKWWTQPSGPLTADIKGEIGVGYVETAPYIAERVLGAATGPAVTNAAAAHGWRGDPAGVHVDEGESTASVLDRLLLPISLLWILDPAGTITLREVTFTGPVATLQSDSVERLRTLPPVKTRRVGYQKSYRTHADGDIAAILLQLDPASATSLLTLSGALDDNILTVQEKTGTVIPLVADLDAQYDQVYARATGLLLSTTALVNAKNTLRAVLATYAVPWNDVDNASILAASAFGDFNFPAGWTLNGATSTANGIYRTIADPDGSWRSIQRTATVPGSSVITGYAVIKRDLVGAATRFPVLRITFQNGTAKAFDFAFDTATGAMVSNTGGTHVPSDFGCVPINDDMWFVYITGTFNANNTLVMTDFYPAVGAGASYVSATTGSVDVKFLGMVVGGMDKVGREALMWRIRNYQMQLAALERGITEASPNLEIPGQIDIDANSSAVTTTPLPLTARCKAWLGPNNKSADATWSLGSPLPAGISATINNTAGHADRGLITVTVADAGGVVQVNCTIPGYAEISKQIPVNRTVAPPSAGGGSGSTLYTATGFADITGTSHATIAGPATVRSTAGGALKYSASTKFKQVSGTTSHNIAIKAQYRTPPGSGGWNDFAAEVSGTGSDQDPDSGVVLKGNVAIAEATKSGLTASTDYEVQLVGRRIAGSVNITCSQANFTVKQ